MSYQSITLLLQTNSTALDPVLAIIEWPRTNITENPRLENALRIRSAGRSLGSPRTAVG